MAKRGKKEDFKNALAGRVAWSVIIIESERGWGQKVDETVYFCTEQDANEFVREFNAGNNEPVTPDWYMRADAPQPVESKDIPANLERSIDGKGYYVSH